MVHRRDTDSADDDRSPDEGREDDASLESPTESPEEFPEGLRESPAEFIEGLETLDRFEADLDDDDVADVETRDAAARDRWEYAGPSEYDIARSEDGSFSNGSGSRWLKSAGIILLVFAALGLLISLVGPLAFGNRGNGSNHPAFTAARVERVIDGNTIIVDVGGSIETVRYIGVAVGFPGESSGRASRLANQSLVDGARIILERDSLDRDTEGRLLRYVYVNNRMVNAALVVNGLARYAPDRTNGRYNGVLLDAEQSARDNNRGIWSGTDASEARPT